MKETIYTINYDTVRFNSLQDISTCQICGDQDEFLMVHDKGNKTNIWLCSSCFTHFDGKRS